MESTCHMKRSAVGRPSSDPRSHATCGEGRRARRCWYMDEVVVKCAGRQFWLWRAVDQQGTVIEEILQKRREKAAKRLLVTLMKRYGFVPKRIVTDKLRSYRAATPAAGHACSGQVRLQLRKLRVREPEIVAIHQ